MLKDGASAVYGSDAIAGVVNIITKNDFEGFEVSAYLGDTTRGGGSRGQIDLVAGGRGDGNNWLFVASTTDDEEIEVGDRQWSQVPLFQAAGVLGNVSGVVEATFTNRESSQKVAEVPLAPLAFFGYDAPYSKDNHHNPLGVDIPDWRRRMVEGGSRTNPTDEDTVRLLFGLRGELDTGWSWDAYFTRGESRREAHFGHIYNLERVRNAVGPTTGSPATDDLQCVADPANCVPRRKADAAGAGWFRDEQDGHFGEWKFILGLGYHLNERIKVSWDVRYIDDVREEFEDQFTSEIFERTLKGAVYHDLQANWHFEINDLPSSLTVGVDNALDEDPSFSLDGFNDNTDVRTFDTAGRFVYARWRIGL